MPKRIAAAAALVLTIGLAGCAADVTAGSGQPDASEPQPQSQQAEESPAPLVAEEPVELDSAEAEAAFLDEVRDRIRRIRTQIPNATDEQLLAAAHEACERIEGGESSEGMSLIEGEEKSDAGYYMDSGAIISSARLTLCPTPTQ